MKQTLLFPLIFLLLCQPLYASQSSYGLGDPKPDSGYQGLKIYIRTYGQDFNKNEAAPSRLKVCCDWGVNKLGKLNRDGVPESVQLVNYYMGFHTMRFVPGKTEAFTTTSKGKKIKIVLLNQEGDPVYGEPTYFQITGYDGAQYREER